MQRVRLRLRRCLAAARDGDDVHVAETPDRVDVMGPDESGPDQAHADPFHRIHHPANHIRFCQQ